jgi:hypothetical protein
MFSAGGQAMADIEIRCLRCSGVTIVSEFVDPDSLACRYCGEPLEKPVETDEEEEAAQGIRSAEMEEQYAYEDAEGFEDSGAGEWRFHRSARSAAAARARAASKFKISYAGICWIIFIVLGGIAGFFRYGGGFSGAEKLFLEQYGVFLLLAVHIFIVLKAFKDSIFSGVLSLLVPFYSLYYLFFVSDDFLLRAVVGALLVAVGQDAVMDLNHIALDVVKAVDRWIQSGGTGGGW